MIMLELNQLKVKMEIIGNSQDLWFLDSGHSWLNSDCGLEVAKCVEVWDFLSP